MLVTRRHFFFGSLALPLLADKKTAGARPNLLLFVVDNLPSWIVGSYGNKEFLTPNLDKLFQTGTKFVNHSVCSPLPALSRAGLLTGRTPMQLGDSESPSTEGGLDKIVSGLGYAVGNADSNAAAQFLDQQAPGKPFLLTVGCPYLHAPYEGVAQKYRDRYAQVKFDTLNLVRTPAANARQNKEMWSDLAGNVRKVAAAVSALDDDAGAILVKLSQKSLLDNTLIVFCSTSGALLGRHGLWGGAAASDPPNLFEETVTTPLVWAWPGRIPAQGIRTELVSTYDFVPTICELLGTQPLAKGLCGRSYLLPVTGKPLPKKQPWRTTIFAHYQNTDMARILRYKLIVRDSGKGPGELYDLMTDPGEMVNQYANPQFMTTKGPLADRLASWRLAYAS